MKQAVALVGVVAIGRWERAVAIASFGCNPGSHA
jgi:hypothetical protein